MGSPYDTQGNMGHGAERMPVVAVDPTGNVKKHVKLLLALTHGDWSEYVFTVGRAGMGLGEVARKHYDADLRSPGW